MESVYNALKETQSEIVLIHDAARPYVTSKMITDCIESVNKYGSGVCALPFTDTAVLARDQVIFSSLKREQLFTVQTPQGFETQKLLHAYQLAFDEQRTFTDDSGVYAEYAAPPRLFEGSRANKKLTFADDFAICDRVGLGVDTHAFYTDGESTPFVNFITLCGVRIPSAKILKAHSDGDVAVHALMDAMLSAAGLRDIGYYFPDNDEKFRGADSMLLLQEVLRLVNKEGFVPKNVSISILAETPRLSPYIENMKEHLAAALSLPTSAIGIAAGTNEKLGYIGEGKGITVYTLAMLGAPVSIE